MPIHPTAIINPQTQLGENVSIGPYAVIGADVTLEDDVTVGAHCVIEGPTRIGRGTRLFPFVSAGQDPQDLKYAGERTELMIGERNVIREFATLHRGTGAGGGVTRIGDDNLLMAQCHVAHDCAVGNRVIMANGASLAGHVEVHDHATLGAYVGVHQFCRVGPYAFIGAYSVIVKDALPYARSVGNHAKCYGPNSLGLRRAGFSGEDLRAIEQAFRLLLNSKLNTSQATAVIEERLGDHPRIRVLLDFIAASQRGVVK
ncbi:MAG: acyl-[acyl-carrier-protein]--UDP-N-acetylglucosamine O-acyltransferase [Chloracidobacterium sp. CP2_5A]|nr:MAG: acyl-[acyl-carrier-protein]--UDP-N-acetylglucosamine O-acyltransferase [Chloracidobacterium sp. CP2_5A]